MEERSQKAVIRFYELQIKKYGILLQKAENKERIQLIIDRYKEELDHVVKDL
ncbi:hypothetical protein JW968_00220 [Candidatus Woesearchaeota archaeon]|nr:hypothetical protein [Candidatus Woesearchaeota archaeon]